MKNKFLAVTMTAVLTMGIVTGCGNAASSTAVIGGADNETAQTVAEETAEILDTESGAYYKVGIVQYVDDASLNQIEKAIEEQLDAKAQELGVTFDYADYTFNGQADSTTLNQIAAELVADEVDVIIPIATPTAMIMQTATEENQIPVVFSAVTDPVGAGLVASMDAPGANITGTSDELDTEAVLNLMLAANPEVASVGLLYDKSQDSSKKALETARTFLDGKGITYVEKTGTTSAEITMAAEALVAAGVDAVFTPTDNTVMTAELAIYEKFVEAGIPQYCGADSFALNGAFLGYGVNYEELGTATADMVVEILVNGQNPATMAVQTLNNGIATVNTETAAAIGLDYSMFKDMCDAVVETVTAQEFEE